MRFDFKEPDLVLNSQQSRAFLSSPSFSGLVKLQYLTTFSLIWIKEGLWHKDLGPAHYHSSQGTISYFYEDNAMDHLPYWKLMLEKYRGTEYEELCLMNIFYR